MNWVTLLTALIPFLQQFANANRQPTPPAPVPTPKQGADAAVAALQQFMNQAAQSGLLQLDAPLVVDGWLGPKTDAAILKAIARLRSLIG